MKWTCHFKELPLVMMFFLGDSMNIILDCFDALRWLAANFIGLVCAG